MAKKQRECLNPDCTAKFIPYHDNHVVCRKIGCKTWLRFFGPNAYKKAVYKFTKEFLDSHGWVYGTVNNINLQKITDLIFTMDDLEKIEEGKVNETG
jgi:hypothetical protein